MKRKEFTITVKCNECGSKNVEPALHMMQGMGLLGLECLDCDNKPDTLYDEQDLEDTINQPKKKEYMCDRCGLHRVKKKDDICDDCNEDE